MDSTTTKGIKQYLTFTLGEELFALEIMKVREVLDYTPVTKVPRTPDFMMGVINLRGSVVPVIDLRLKFNMEKTKRTVNTCIIILEVSLEGENAILGVLADSVQEVFEMDTAEIEPPPKIGTQLNTEFIDGMGKREDGFIIILDIDKVFTYAELTQVTDVAEEGEKKEIEEVNA